MDILFTQGSKNAVPNLFFIYYTFHEPRTLRLLLRPSKAIMDVERLSVIQDKVKDLKFLGNIKDKTIPGQSCIKPTKSHSVMDNFELPLFTFGSVLELKQLSLL